MAAPQVDARPARPGDERAPRAPARAGAVRTGGPSSGGVVVGALALLVAGVLLRGGAPLAGALGGGSGRPPVPAAVVASVVAALALLALVAARRSAATIAGVAALAPAALVADLVLVVAPETAARPELARPGDPASPAALAALVPGPGAVLLLVGDVLVLAAGAVALRALLRPNGVAPADGGTGRADRAPGSATVPVAGALLAGLGFLVASFSAAPGSGLDPRSALDTPAPAGPGAGLLALTVVVAAFAAGTAGPRARARALGGLAAACAAVALPVLVASVATPGLGPTSGPPLVLVGAAVIAAAAAGGRARTVSSRAVGLRARVPGVAAVATTAASVVAVVAPTLTLPPGAVAAPGVEGSGRLLWAAAAVLAVPGLLVAAGPRRLGARVRPVLSVAWLGVPFAAGASLDVVLAGLDDRSVAVAAGGWAVLVALALAVTTAVLAVAAGAVERRDVAAAVPSTAVPPTAAEPDATMLPVAALAAVLAVPALGGPLARDALGATGRPWADASAASWGALVALLGVATAVLLAPRARAPRALALLLGAAGLLVVRLSALALTPPGPGEQVGVGTWAAGACLLAVLAAVGVAVSGLHRPAPGRGADVSGVAPVAGTAPRGRG